MNILPGRRENIPLHGKHELTPIPIVGDGAIAAPGIGDGHLIPVLIVDTTNRSDVEELVKAHEHLPPGDVDVSWGRKSIFSEKKVALILQFIRPAEITIFIEFDIMSQGVLVDQILSVHGMYLQPGRPGDRISSTPKHPRITIEIPETGFSEIWDSRFHKLITKKMRRRGLSKREARLAAESYIQQFRKFGRMRAK